MRLAFSIPLIIAVLDPASAQNPPTAYTAQTTPYDDTTAWYCEVVTGTLNKQCTFLGLRQSLVTLPNLTSASLLTTTGVITSGGLGTGASINFGGLTYNGTNGIPLNQLPTSLATLPLVVAQGGTGTATPALVAGNGITLAGAFPNTTITAATGAAVSLAPSNPAGTTSLTIVMAGVGSTCTVTPTKTGKLMLAITGSATTNTSGDGCGIRLQVGTGTAPVNGATSAGTVLGNVQYFAGLATGTVPMAQVNITSGQALGTALWFDLGFEAITGGTCTLANLSCSAMEQ